jgi:hypothetical protein
MKSSTPEQGEYKLLRGQRILAQLNEDSTYPGLYREIQRGFPDTNARQNKTGEVAVTNLQYLPFARNNVLQVNATVRSNQHVYTPVIQFLGVTFEPEDTEMNVTFTGKDGQEHNVQPIDLTQSTVKVRCNCLDFFYRFATWNFNDNSLYGKKPPMYRRVPGSNRPPANPAKVPGVCKHVIKTVETLRQYGFVK